MPNLIGSIPDTSTAVVEFIELVRAEGVTVAELDYNEVIACLVVAGLGL